jgi:folate-binding protein YgfZ
MPESEICGAARAGGGVCVAVDGWDVPVAFADPATEYRALREDAALVDLAYRTRVRVTGSDRVDFLHGMLSNDVKGIGPGRGCWALLLTEHGKVVADCIVLVLTDAILLDGVGSAVAAAIVVLERHVIADDVELTALGGADHAFGVYGPGAARALGRLGIVTEPAENYAHAVVEVQGIALRIARVPAPGAGGFLCLVPGNEAVAWWTRCVEGGLSPAGQQALEVLRIESGTPAYGRDVGPDTIALEAPFDTAISFAKGCYLGQEVVERVTARGHVNRKLVGLEVAGATVPPAGAALFAHDHEVGWVTSAAWSWRLACPVALAYVRRDHLEPGTMLDLHLGAGATPATVRALPLIQ